MWYEAKVPEINSSVVFIFSTSTHATFIKYSVSLSLYSKGSVVGQFENATNLWVLYLLVSYIIILSPTSASITSNGSASSVVYIYFPW